MKQYFLFLILLFIPAFSHAQDYDYGEMERVLEYAMTTQIDDPGIRRKACFAANLLGGKKFSEGRYEDAIRMFRFSNDMATKAEEQLKFINSSLLVHALCLTHHRDALTELQNLFVLLQNMQSNDLRGDFPVEYADGLKHIMNNTLLPLMSEVLKAFPDTETYNYCFNLTLYLKLFAFYQIDKRKISDIKNDLRMDYRSLLAASLRDDEIAIEFVPYLDTAGKKALDNCYAAFVLDSNADLHFVNVCRKKEVENLYEYNDSTWMLYNPKDRRLDSMLWLALKPYTAGKKRIYLSPCGLLNRVNFLLFDPRIHELSSLYELTKTYPENPHKEALLIGDIDYDDYIISTIRGDRDWGELLGTKQEIDSIVSTLSPFYHITRLTGKEGSEPMVRRLLAPPPAILHFATHAICYTDSIHRSQQPFFNFPYNYYPEREELSFTGLVLSGGNLGFQQTGNRSLDDDGILLSEEIYQLPLEGTSLVVLSACNSGNGVFDDIEGTFGLVKAFKLAGVRTVIASLSKVEDEATSLFMSFFYRCLSQGEPMHGAFVHTINHMRLLYPDRPKYWASFKMIDSMR